MNFSNILSILLLFSISISYTDGNTDFDFKYNSNLNDGSSASPVGDLPGAPKIIPQMYSGYVNVNEDQGTYLFFWLVIANQNGDTAPLVMWLTGGPGCSSVYGSLAENGPFRVGDNGTYLTINEYSWNNAANMLYVESPPGVGFSFSESGNYTCGDNCTADYNYQFLQGFYKLFPSFAENDFYIAGESYAGHYVPQLAYEIFTKDTNGSIPLKGWLAGNPSTCGYDGTAYWPFMANHAMMSVLQFQKLNSTCKGVFSPPSSECESYMNELLPNFALINPYNIYAQCIGNGPSASGGCLTSHATLLRGEEINSKRESLSQTFVPCLETANIVNYMNLPQTQLAFNVVQQMNTTWDVCSSVLNYVQYAPSVLPIYQQLVPYLRVMVYSGDVDSCVPYLATEECINSLDFPIIDDYRPWYFMSNITNTNQTAGYVTTYKNLQYATVKDAGHMVPFFKPFQAFELFSRFLADIPL